MKPVQLLIVAVLIMLASLAFAQPSPDVLGDLSSGFWAKVAPGVDMTLMSITALFALIVTWLFHLSIRPAVGVSLGIGTVLGWLAAQNAQVVDGTTVLFNVIKGGLLYGCVASTACLLLAPRFRNMVEAQAEEKPKA